MCRIIFYFFRFYYAEMRRNLWPKASAKERATWQRIFKFTLYYIWIFLRNRTKQFTIEPKSYTAMLLYLFLILYCLLAQIKWKLKNGPRLPTLPYSTRSWLSDNLCITMFLLHFVGGLNTNYFRHYMFSYKIPDTIENTSLIL